MERTVRHEALTGFAGSALDREFLALAAEVRRQEDAAAWIYSPEVSLVLAENNPEKAAKEYAHDPDEE